MSFSLSAQERISVEAYYDLYGNSVNCCNAAGHSSVCLNPACGYSPILSVIVWVGEIGIERFEYSIVESHENWEIIFILRISGSVLWIFFKPWCWEHWSWYLLSVLWEYPRKGLCRGRTEGSSHIVGV